ncbi:oligosaccharide flippase family protein [Defluviimonas salinarum]|uniref:Oligosaccharide flippase family protein n=1 Tax=Defluviimonas salinarum TaxID=2992147 RepID=A0ABT3J812_9RHOB|nr:oligosaccharide flippase family protein [Defluviimonas salinarum]MCW3783806.1 oligosaccharide flippase family protein [Defluviimonas salinarum]
MLKKAAMLVSGNALGSALLLARNLIVARLVSPEDYGIAATFAIVMSVVEMLSQFGLSQMIVVDKDGDDPRFQSVMQGFQLARGVFASLVLLVIAHPTARFLGIEHVAWAYQVIAVVPLINGLQHFDIHRLKRHLNFRPFILSQSIPPLVALLAIWPLALLYGDYRIMLISLLVQAGAMALLSHLAAERRYQIGFDLALIRRATVFGWPLLINGALLFGVFYGERVIVGRELGMAALGVFSMAVTLTLTPTLVMANANQSAFLPHLSSARERPAAFQWLGVAAVEAGLAAGLVLLLGIVLLGGPVVHLLLGEKYAAILPLLVPVAVLQAVRMAKTGSTTVALSRERTGNAVAANLLRVSSLPVSWLVVHRTGDVMLLIWIAVGAEVLGYLLSLHLAARRTGLKLGPVVLPSLLAALTCAAALAVDGFEPTLPDLAGHLLRWPLLVVMVCGLAALASMKALRGYIFRQIRNRAA